MNSPGRPIDNDCKIHRKAEALAPKQVFGFVNTYHGLIIPAAFTAFGTFLLRQFMLSIPTSLDEAATIDGAGHWRIFWDVIVPLARPGLIALCILTFLGGLSIILLAIGDASR
jgi:ABC-type glycerol-3-phosphate transport system permease component